MSASQSMNASVTLEQQSRAFGLSGDERKGTSHAARIGHVIADAIARIFTRVKGPRVEEFQSPSQKSYEPAGPKAERFFMNALL